MGKKTLTIIRDVFLTIQNMRQGAQPKSDDITTLGVEPREGHRDSSCKHGYIFTSRDHSNEIHLLKHFGPFWFAGHMARDRTDM